MTQIFVPESGSAPRVKPEAEQYYRRNQGSLKTWFDDKANKDYSSPRPNPRCPTPAAQAQYERHRGKMNLWLDATNNTNYSSPRKPPRCQSARARVQYDKAQGCMGDLITGSPSIANHIPIHPRAVKAEAASNAAGHKGTFTKMLFENYGNVPRSVRLPPRVKPEAQSNLKKNNGCMANLFSNYGNHPSSARPAPKVKPEGGANADKDRGGQASKILSMAPPSGRDNPMEVS